MTSAESDKLNQMLAEAGIDRDRLAIRLGVALTTARKWGTKSLPVPQYATAYLDLMIKYKKLEADREGDGLAAIEQIIARMRGKQ